MLKFGMNKNFEYTVNIDLLDRIGNLIDESDSDIFANFSGNYDELRLMTFASLPEHPAYELSDKEILAKVLEQIRLLEEQQQDDNKITQESLTQPQKEPTLIVSEEMLPCVQEVASLDEFDISEFISADEFWNQLGTDKSITAEQRAYLKKDARKVINELLETRKIDPSKILIIKLKHTFYYSKEIAQLLKIKYIKPPLAPEGWYTKGAISKKLKFTNPNTALNRYGFTDIEYKVTKICRENGLNTEDYMKLYTNKMRNQAFVHINYATVRQLLITYDNPKKHLPELHELFRGIEQ